MSSIVAGCTNALWSMKFGDSYPKNVLAISAADVRYIAAFVLCRRKDRFGALVHLVSTSWAWAQDGVSFFIHFDWYCVTRSFRGLHPRFGWVWYVGPDESVWMLSVGEFGAVVVVVSQLSLPWDGALHLYGGFGGQNFSSLYGFESVRICDSSKKEDPFLDRVPFGGGGGRHDSCGSPV